MKSTFLKIPILPIHHHFTNLHCIPQREISEGLHAFVNTLGALLGTGDCKEERWSEIHREFTV